MPRRNRNFSRANNMGYGFRRGYGMRCNFGRGYGMRCSYGIMRNYNPGFPEFLEDEMEIYDISEKDAIIREKELLESRLAFLNTELDNITGD